MTIRNHQSPKTKGDWTGSEGGSGSRPGPNQHWSKIQSWTQSPCDVGLYEPSTEVATAVWDAGSRTGFAAAVVDLGTDDAAVAAAAAS
jgi:hypothetical protein